MNRLEPGSVLDNKYEILACLNEIGPSEVYLARHLHLDAQRVVKVLGNENARDPEVLARFQREALTATQIQHPRIATLYDYSVIGDGDFYMVWEYIEGRDLASWLDRHGRVPLLPGVELAIQGLEGLLALHEAGILHRDVSPDNMMLTRDAAGAVCLKLIDFGLARTTADAELESGFFGGKFLYCSPEQAGVTEGGTVDHRSDLYCFGLVIYEMLTGHRPWTSGQEESLEARFGNPPLPMRSRNPEVEIPVELDRTVMRALSASPQARQQDARELLAELERALRGLRAEERLRDEQVRLSGSRPIEDDEERRPDAVPDEIRDAPSLVGIAERSLRAGRLELAESAMRRLRALERPPLGMAELERRLEDSRARRLRMQVMQTEELLEQHIQERRQGLAELALEVLVQLAPDHPERAALEWRVESIGSKLGPAHDPRRMFEEGRRLAVRGDLDGARRIADQLRHDQRGAHFSRQLDQQVKELEKGERSDRAARKLKAQVEKLLEVGRIDEAEQEINKLSALSVPRLVTDLLRQRIDESRDVSRRHWQGRMIEMRFPRLLENRDWEGARGAARELRELLPASERPAEMLAEVDRCEREEERQDALIHGRQLVEQFLESERLSEAETALATLIQLDPDHPDRARLENELKACQSNELEYSPDQAVASVEAQTSQSAD